MTANIFSSAAKIARKIYAAVCCLILWLSCTSVALAEDAAAAGGEKTYAVGYLIVVLLVSLGMFITLRPSGRATEVKRLGVYEDL